MAITILDIETYLSAPTDYLIIDVRSIAEFEHAHIPKAINIPIFDNEERKIIGTTYKQESRKKAIKIGLEYFGKKLVEYIEVIEFHIKNETIKNKPILLYCWRGGMRSAAMAWLFNLYGYKVFTIKGGYKAYRQWSLKQFLKDYNFKVIGGYTGSHKTVLLNNLQSQGELVIDLENLANHNGSAFGGIGKTKQPSQEMFENQLAFELYSIFKQGIIFAKKYIFIEDESQRIGNLNIPIELFKTMRNGKTFFIDLNFEIRLENILEEYGKLDPNHLIEATIRITKRLGGLDTKNVVECIQKNEIKNAFEILLKYYDKQYIQHKTNNVIPKREVIYKKIDGMLDIRELILFINKN